MPWCKIIIPCPICAHEKRNLYSEAWTHGGICGGNLYIDENAIVHCLRCGKSAHISRMLLTCNSLHHEKKRITRDEIGAALAIGNVGVTNNAASLKWFKKMLENI